MALVSVASAVITRRSVERELVIEMAKQAEAFRQKREAREVEYQRAIAPLVVERNRLRARLAQYENAPKPVPPRDDRELVERLKRLGY